MRKLPVGPIVVGMVIIGLIGGFLLTPAKQPPAADKIAVVVAPPTPGLALPPPANATAPTAQPTIELAPGEDPPARREPGAINYADKGVLPAL